MSKKAKDHKPNILVYGIEKVGLTQPSEKIETKNFLITFGPFDTDKCFNEFDGVILYQGIFEYIKYNKGRYESYYDFSYDKDMLDKRLKEVKLLNSNGGFVCHLLNEQIFNQVDGYKENKTNESDLTKYALKKSEIKIQNLENRQSDLKAVSDEFRQFIDVNGGASSVFKVFPSNSTDFRDLVKIDGYSDTVGMVINRNTYFLPTLIPDNPDKLITYFTGLTTGLLSSHNKLRATLPDWIEEFIFNEEEHLHTHKEELEKEILELNNRLVDLHNFKSVLALSGDDLVKSMTDLFETGFGIKVDTEDKFIEDIKLLDSSDEPICLCEIKGTNSGVKREYINQTDTHRERSGFKDDFPAILIVNTHIKKAKAINEKDQEIANEQIQHAVKIKVLVLRTIDLLELLKIFLSKEITLDEVKELLTVNYGWLKVSSGKYEIIESL